jgi:hypothetical protein
MKNLFLLIITPFFLLSCAGSKQALTHEGMTKKDRKFAEQQMVKKAIESARFIVRFDRIYYSYGGMADLVPRANYILVDGSKAAISAAYLGRQSGFRPISGINMAGKTTEYNIKSNVEKGRYDVNLKVNGRTDSFTVYLTIGADGTANVSMSSARLSNVRYTGHIQPIQEKPKAAPAKRGSEDLI